MWPRRAQRGEDVRLYVTAEALSDFCYSLYTDVPTGKGSLSLIQKYPDGEEIISPGTVIISAGGEMKGVRNVVSPVLVSSKNSSLYYIDFSLDDQRLGGSTLTQNLGKVNNDVPTTKNPEYFADYFGTI